MRYSSTSQRPLFSFTNVHVLFHQSTKPTKKQAPTVELAPGEQGGSNAPRVPPTYTKYVTKQFAKMEVRWRLHMYVCVCVCVLTHGCVKRPLSVGTAGACLWDNERAVTVLTKNIEPKWINPVLTNSQTTSNHVDQSTGGTEAGGHPRGDAGGALLHHVARRGRAWYVYVV